ncbi:MAG: DUF4292 domain-containing protein [Deltaproteobacteria bacterium]|nr:DUF4292 domain-containing protein [Deltaproteobacteria bacterium]
MDMRFTLVASLTLALAGCPGGGSKNGGGKRDYADPTAADVVKRLEQQHAERTGFSAESVMDYWIGKDRLKGTVLVMGTTGKKVRFNALSPAGGDVLADMACDGTSFAYVDKQNNCQLSGPCDRSSIATLLRFELEPEDFLYFAVGTVPIAATDGTVTWDGKSGHEQVTLTGPNGTQTLEVDLRGGRADVIKSELKNSSGTVVWSVENADFGNVKDAAGKEHRLPGKTRFKAPNQQADLVVEWGERTLNPDLTNPLKFQVSVPPGLPGCGQT